MARADAGAAARWLLLLAVLLPTPAFSEEGTAPPQATPPKRADARPQSSPETLNGFSLDGLRVEQSLLVRGAVRDGIKAVDEPGFVPPEAATWVAPDNLVLGLALGEVAHAYPVHVLEFHQIVNDALGGEPVLVTYDPLAGAPRAFGRRLGERTLRFGVSGLLHNASFLLYDRETRSLWSAWTGEAVAGPLAGKRLPALPVRQEPLARWLERAPTTRVLERPAPRRIDYRYSPFSSYWVADSIPFPVAARDERFHAKEVVLGLRVGKLRRAYLGSALTAAGGSLEDRLGGHGVRISYDSEVSAFDYEVPKEVEVREAYWFAWKAFVPDTEVWLPPKE